MPPDRPNTSTARIRSGTPSPFASAWGAANACVPGTVGSASNNPALPANRTIAISATDPTSAAPLMNSYTPAFSQAKMVSFDPFPSQSAPADPAVEFELSITTTTEVSATVSPPPTRAVPSNDTAPPGAAEPSTGEVMSTSSSVPSEKNPDSAAPTGAGTADNTDATTDATTNSATARTGPAFRRGSPTPSTRETRLIPPSPKAGSPDPGVGGVAPEGLVAAG